MGWIILFGPLLGGIFFTLVQMLAYKILVSSQLLKSESVPHPPVLIIRSFALLIITVTAAYFYLLAGGTIVPIDINTIPEGFGASSQPQSPQAAPLED